ncbi:MAG: TlpA family protein disulfide reductase [Deltaproteobacteria bacterium]|nr:TlpA family protein disulfide reductase [Deltaproteobacteria bacterium]
MTQGFVLLMTTCLIGSLVACGGPPPPVAVGQPAPSFELPVLGGGTLAKSELAGRPTVISFWATWCQPCHKEIPVLNQLVRDGSAEVVAISLDEGGWPAIERFVAQREISYRVVLGNQEVFARFDGVAIPYTLVLDASGTIVGLHRGPVGEEELLREVRMAQGREVDHDEEAKEVAGA